MVGQTTPRQKAQQLYEQAQTHENAKEYEQAVKKINEAITLDAGDDQYLAQYLAYASHVERLAGRYADGVEHGLRAIKLNPTVGGTMPASP